MRILLKKIRQSMLAGILVLLPVILTVQILLFAFHLLDGVFGARINFLLRTWVPGWEYNIPGVGLIVLLVVVLGVGYFTRYVYFKRVLQGLDLLMGRIPIVRSIYSAAKQLTNLFKGSAALPFSQVVMVEYPMAGRFTMGLMAREQVDDTRGGADDLVVVFMPSNHLHLGYPVVVRRSDVRPLEMKVEEAVKFFMSCGVLLTDAIDLQRTMPPRTEKDSAA